MKLNFGREKNWSFVRGALVKSRKCLPKIIQMPKWIQVTSTTLEFISVSISVITIPIPKGNSVSIFGIKNLAGASQKIGGSPLFPMKGLLLKKKRNSRGIVQNKSSRKIFKMCSRQSLQYKNTDRKYRYRLYLIPYYLQVLGTVVEPTCMYVFPGT